MKLILLAICFLSASAMAVVDGHKYPFDNDADTMRFEKLATDLRCPKCQNQNLADSNAPIAKDLRDKVYELMQQGNSDDEIVDYLVARYGDFVRYKPPFRLDTFFLWGGPALLFLAGLLLIAKLRRQQKQPVDALSEEEQQRLATLKSQLLQDNDV